MTQDKVLEALTNVQEPDLGKDIVTLNMVRDVAIDGNRVSFTVVLTTPACPLKDLIRNACINAIKLLLNKDADVQVKAWWHAAGVNAARMHMSDHSWVHIQIVLNIALRLARLLFRRAMPFR